jgi:hypothetical protein
VTLTSTTPGATIYYTVNGATPTTGSAKYSGAIVVSGNATIEAMAAASGYLNSAVASANYTITQPWLALATSASAPKAGQSIELTATLTAPGAASLSGTWTIADGGATLCTASQTTQTSFGCPAKLTHGTHALTASYTGKTNGWALAAALTLTVN